MKNLKVADVEVLEEYRILGGLVENGRMVNRDKASRAREYVKHRRKLVAHIIKNNQIQENSKYGEFILQTNEVQYYLLMLILLRSFKPSLGIRKKLERLQLGQLIVCFNVCVRNNLEASLITSLTQYKKSRDALAHKMFTDKKLTLNECNIAIKLGDEIIKLLKVIITDE